MARKLLLIATLAGVLVVAAPASGRVGSSGALVTNSATGKSQLALAKRLAADVYGAQSNTGRYKALLNVMRAMHVGVYSGRGKPVVRGAERSWKDDYLYVPEVQGLARSFKARFASQLDIAVELSRLGVRNGKQPFHPRDVLLLAQTGVRSALAHPAARVALTALIVRDLGLHHRPAYDLGKEVSLARTMLDPAQEYLFVTALLASAHKRAHATASARSVAPGTAEIPCSPPESSGLATIVGWIDKDDPTFGTGPDGIAPADHAVALTTNIVIRKQPPYEQSTHYGPTGHSSYAGDPMLFRWFVGVAGPSVYSRIYCGVMAGTELPPAGPLGNVPVHPYDVGPDRPLADYGSFDSAATRADGNVTLRFAPHNEAVPDFGKVLNASGEVTITIPTSSIYRGLPASIAALVGPHVGAFDACTGEFGNTDCSDHQQQSWLSWRVGRHAPRGFQFGPVNWNEGDYGGDFHFSDAISGHVCGENPFEGTNSPWDITFAGTDAYNGSSETYDVTEPLYGPNIQGMATDINPVPPDATKADALAASPRLTFLNPGPNPQVRVERITPGGFHGDSTVPITQDMSCPAPTP